MAARDRGLSKQNKLEFAILISFYQKEDPIEDECVNTMKMA